MYMVCVFCNVAPTSNRDPRAERYQQQARKHGDGMAKTHGKRNAGEPNNRGNNQR
jgi:hypothetical protein